MDDVSAESAEDEDAIKAGRGESQAERLGQGRRKETRRWFQSQSEAYPKERSVKAHSHPARLRPSTSVARRASTDVDARVHPSTRVDVRRRM